MDLTQLVPDALIIGSSLIAFLLGRTSVGIKYLTPQSESVSKVKAFEHDKCSECNLLVARHFMRDEKVVCANCDPLGFEKSRLS